MRLGLDSPTMSNSSPPRLITAFCLSYGHWTVIPHQLKASFKEMRDCGFNAVALSFSESEMRYSRRAFEIQVDLAHRCGLKVLVIPSRIGNRFAGAPLMPSLWLSQHPEAQLPDHHGFAGPIAWPSTFMPITMKTRKAYMILHAD